MEKTKSKGRVGHETYASRLIPWAFNSFLIARLIQADIEASPSLAKASLMPRSNSGSTRKAICLLPLTLFSFDNCLTPIYSLAVREVYDNSRTKTTKPESALTLFGLLTTTVMRATIMAANKFTFLLAQSKQCIADLHEIRLISVIAHSESEARLLAGRSGLVFVSRVSVSA